MRYTRRRMLQSFEQLELDLEGHADNMSFYESLSYDELAELHRETFDGMYKDTYFEIIDDNGVVKGGFKTFDQAEYALGKLKEDNYKFKGDVKIVEVRYVSLKKYSAR